MMSSKLTRGRFSNLTLWAVQLLLALLFGFAGISKLAMPIDVLVEQSHLPGGLMRFIGAAELMGAIGLILPGLLHIWRKLTPLAAIGLAIIMLGAVVISLVQSMVAAAMVPLVVAILLGVVIFGRKSWALSIS